MIDVPFTVNDESVRTGFLQDGLFEALTGIGPSHAPLWGGMRPHQMVEHLVWAVELSNGVTEVECRLPAKLVERFKTFLSTDDPTSHDFKNPELKKGLPPLRFGDIPTALEALRRQTVVFLDNRNDTGAPLRVHPVFGPLNHEEWSRAHFKHFYHHLLQFGLISPPRGA